MSQKPIRLITLFLIIELIPNFCISQRKELGYLSSCNSVKESYERRSYIYRLGNKYQLCTGIGFKVVQIDTVINNKREKIDSYISCDTCMLECSQNSYLFEKSNRYIRVLFFNSADTKLYTRKILPLITNLKIPYVGLFPSKDPYNDSVQIKGIVQYQGDTTIIDGINVSHSCYVFYVKYNKKQHQTVYSQRLFIDKRILLPIKIQNYDNHYQLIDCTFFIPTGVSVPHPNY